MKHLSRLILFILCLNLGLHAESLRLGSFVDDGKTVFRVYSTSKSPISLRIYKSKVSKSFRDYEMKPLNNPDSYSGIDRTVAQSTFEVRLEGNLKGNYYHYVLKNSQPDPYTEKTICSSQGTDAFIFHRGRGYLMGTTARGFRTEIVDGVEKDLAQSNIKKFSKDGQTCFEMTDGTDFSKYHVEINSEGSFPESVHHFGLLDPYCFEVERENHRCKILDLNDPFSKKVRDVEFLPGHVIHEVHLKDLSILMPGVPENMKGTYAGATHKQTLKRLKDLEVSTIEFLPLHQFDRFAAPPGHINYWGYMTESFFAFHKEYAQQGADSLQAFQQMVTRFKESGFQVVLDVVYNHTAEGDHRGPLLGYKSLARNEYYRMHDAKKGYFDNTTGVGNTSRSESPVMRKLILDSLKFLHYYLGVDGFRFDLAAAIDKETLHQIRKELGPDVILTGEPWVAAGSPQWMRGDLNEIEFGKWNDAYRLAIKGGNGKPGFMNGEGNEYEVKVLIRGEHQYFGGSGSFVDTSTGNTNPRAVINELSVHDGYTLYDHLTHYQISDEEIQKRMRLGSTILLTSINTPIVQLGMEFARTKGGNHNSYDEDSPVNYLDWNRFEKYQSLVKFNAGLKKLRSYYDAFQVQDRIQDDRLIFVEDSSQNNRAFGYYLRGSEYSFLILINSAPDQGADFHFEKTVFDVVSNGEVVSNRGLGKVMHGHYFLSPSSTVILRKKN